MVIDTGAVGSIAYFSRSFAIQNKLTERAVASAPDTLGRTACRIERFALGSLGVDRPVVHHFGTPGFGGKTEPDGMIAADFLRRFRVFLDYGRGRMILEPNRSYAEPPAFDASGLRVHRIPNSPDAFRIYEVLPGTPAAEAGLQASDLLVALDDTPVQRMSPGMVQEALSRDGRECSLADSARRRGVYRPPQTAPSPVTRKSLCRGTAPGEKNATAHPNPRQEIKEMGGSRNEPFAVCVFSVGDAGGSEPVRAGPDQATRTPAGRQPRVQRAGSAIAPAITPQTTQPPGGNRAFGVFPNYRTADMSQIGTALTPRQKFTIASQGFFRLSDGGCWPRRSRASGSGAIRTRLSDRDSRDTGIGGLPAMPIRR